MPVRFVIKKPLSTSTPATVRTEAWRKPTGRLYGVKARICTSRIPLQQETDPLGPVRVGARGNSGDVWCASTVPRLFQYTILHSQLVCTAVFKFTGRVFLTRLWLLSESGILIASYCIYPLFLWRFLHGRLSPWNSFDCRVLLFPCPFSTRCHWSIFRNGSFLVFPIQFGCLYKLCSQHFSTLCRKHTIF